ncbi:MAG: phage holin family protein [Verrucomicrobiota bacterium]
MRRDRERPEAAPAGWLETGRRFAGTILSTLGNRVELLLVEAQEERDRLLQVLLLGVVALVFFTLAMVAVSVAVVVVFWASHPVASLLGLAVLYAGLGGAAAWRLARARQDWDSFAGSLNELKKDREWLETEPE